MADALGLEMDLLHVPLGLVIFLGLAALFRRTRHPLLYGLLGVTLLQFLNEALDAVQWHAWTGRVHWEEALQDTAITLILPVLITAWAWIARHRQQADVAPDTEGATSQETPADEETGAKNQG